METKHITTAATLKTEGGEAGSLEAAFVRFNNRDRDGDVILPSAFTDGQEVIMTWAHDWAQPIGKGRVRVEAGRAVFSGRLWLDTHDGEQAYRRIKNAGSLQQYSWGFQVIDSERGDFRGERSRFIKATELFEVSPVLIGAAGTGNTATLSVKHARPTAPPWVRLIYLEARQTLAKHGSDPPLTSREEAELLRLQVEDIRARHGIGA